MDAVSNAIGILVRKEPAEHHPSGEAVAGWVWELSSGRRRQMTKQGGAWYPQPNAEAVATGETRMNTDEKQKSLLRK